MSETQDAPAAPETAGAMLRRAREAAGLHVAALAVNLKVPVRKLEALEDDRHDLLPDAVFVRALASSVCRTLKIDPKPVLERLPVTAKPRLVQDDDGINAPFRAPGEGPKPGLSAQFSRPVVLSVLVLLLGAVVLIFLPVTSGDDKAAAGKAEQVMPPGTPVTVTAPAVEPRPVAQVVPAAAPAVPAPPAAPPATPRSPAAPAQPPVPAPVAVSMPAGRASPPVVAQPLPAPAPAARPASASVAAAVPAAVPAATAPVPAGVIAFRTKGASWILVTDAKGNEVLRRLMNAGDTAGASGALPLTVTVGSAEATEVQVRGKPFNLAPVSRDNVARFEVK